MAQAKVMNGSKLLIRIDDGSGSNFVHQCSINSDRGIVFGSSPNEQMIPDCDDPDAPSWIEREIDGLTASINGSGMFDTPSLDFFWTWYSGANARAIQVAVNVDAAVGGGYWYGDAVLSEFSLTSAGKRQKVEFSCTILSDGILQWLDAS